MQHLHDTMEKVSAEVATSRALRKAGIKKMRELSEGAQQVEDFALGIIDGMSYISNPKCVDALESTVSSGFDVYDNKEAYKPSKVVKLTIATQKFTQSTNLCYT